MLDERDQRSAQHRAVQRPFSSQQHGDQHQARLPPPELRRIHESVQRRVEVSGQPRDQRADDERGQFVPARREPQRAHARLVDADPDQYAAERTARHALQQQVGANERGPDRDVDGRPLRDWTRRDVEPVRPAEPGRLVEEVEQHLRERKRDHHEVDAAGAQGEPADAEGDDSDAKQTQRKRGGKRSDAGAVAQTCEQGRGKAVESRMREADHPAVPDEEVEARGKDARDHHLGGELHPEAIGDQWNQRQCRRHDEQRDADAPVHRAACPKKPRRRQSSTAAITAYTTALDTPGSSTLPNVSAMPTRSAPTNAPFTDPIPPITTTTNDTISTPSPMPGYTVVSGAASMPTKAASAVPAAKRIESRRRTSMPSASTISLSVAPARTRMPKRVPSRTCRIASAIARQIVEVNARYADHVCASPSAMPNEKGRGVGTPWTSLPKRKRCRSFNTSTSPYVSRTCDR